MADTKISGLTAAGSAALANEYAINEAGTSKKVTGTQIQTMVLTNPVFPAGSASAGTWPILTAGTLLTTAEDGALEMDANCMYGTTDAGNRGVLTLWNFIRQHADRGVFANNTSQQAVFDSVTNGTITLETGAYIFDGMIQVKATSATSGNVKWSLLGAGSATLAVILQHISGQDVAVDTVGAVGGSALIAATSTATNIVTASTATVTTLEVRGSFECTVAGTLIPSVAQTTGTASQVTTAGSYFRLCRIGATTVTNCGQWT